MAGTTRLLFAPARGQGDAVARHVGRLVAQGLSVLVVTVAEPAESLLQALRANGVDTSRVLIVDAAPAAHGPHDPNVARVPSPSFLELLTMRVRKVMAAKAQGRPHFVIHSLDAIARYNPPQAIRELFHYVRGTRAFPDADIDFIADAERTCDPDVLAFVENEVRIRSDLETAR